MDGGGGHCGEPRARSRPRIARGPTEVGSFVNGDTRLRQVREESSALFVAKGLALVDPHAVVDETAPFRGRQGSSR